MSSHPELLPKKKKKKKKIGHPTREHGFYQIPVLNLRGRAQPLQNVVRRRVVAEEQDLVIHAVKAALGNLKADGNGSSS